MLGSVRLFIGQIHGIEHILDQAARCNCTSQYVVSQLPRTETALGAVYNQ